MKKVVDFVIFFVLGAILAMFIILLSSAVS
jgi:hypothetical protein